jgi:hypothetical protein
LRLREEREGEAWLDMGGLRMVGLALPSRSRFLFCGLALTLILTLELGLEMVLLPLSTLMESEDDEGVEALERGRLEDGSTIEIACNSVSPGLAKTRGREKEGRESDVAKGGKPEGKLP